MKTSATGLRLIKTIEGLRLRAYRDAKGVWTIGYGHTKGVRRGMTCTRRQAAQWLREDVASAEAAVTRLVTRRLRQCQFDALVSFVFNIGAGAFRRSTLRRVVNAGDHAYVPRELTRWVHAGGRPLLGLARRRVVEADLYLSR